MKTIRVSAWDRIGKLDRWNGGGDTMGRARGSPGSLAWRIISDPRLPPLFLSLDDDRAGTTRKEELDAA